MPQRIILDTDIGDDIDDAPALGLICRSPELVGVTTVFGNVKARMRQARTVLVVAGDRFARVPVAAGFGASIASRPLHNADAYLQNTLPNQTPAAVRKAGSPRCTRHMPATATLCPSRSAR